MILATPTPAQTASIAAAGPNFLEGEPSPGIAAEYELYRRFLPGIRLDEVNARLQDQHSPGLYLDSFLRGNLQLYLLVPEESYGLGEKALPR